MKRYRVRIPYQDDMGSISPFIVSETPMGICSYSRFENALWEFNCMRRHDSLPERKTLPKGTTFELIE